MNIEGGTMKSKRTWIRIKTKVILKLNGKPQFGFNYEAITMVQINRYYDT